MGRNGGEKATKASDPRTGAKPAKLPPSQPTLRLLDKPYLIAEVSVVKEVVFAGLAVCGFRGVLRPFSASLRLPTSAPCLSWEVPTEIVFVMCISPQQKSRAVCLYGFS